MLLLHICCHCCLPAGLVGHQVLGLLECIKAKLLAEGGQLVPACATLYAMGIEVVTPSNLQLQRLPGSWQQYDTNNSSSSHCAEVPGVQQAGSWQQHGTDSSSSSSSSRGQCAEVTDEQQGDVALDLSALEQFR
jgi:hypothetical protein